MAGLLFLSSRSLSQGILRATGKSVEKSSKQVRLFNFFYESDPVQTN